MEPEDLLAHPPLGFVGPVIFAAPPVVGAGPPCIVAFDHAADAHEDDEYEDDRKAYLAVSDESECKEKYKIKDGEDYREPCVLVHHCYACDIGDPLLFLEMDLKDGIKRRIDQNVNIEGEYDGLDDPLLDESLKVVRLGVIALEQAVAGAEKEYRYEVSSCIYEGQKDPFLLECLLL